MYKIGGKKQGCPGQKADPCPFIFNAVQRAVSSFVQVLSSK